MNILLIDKMGFQLQTRVMLLKDELAGVSIDTASFIDDVKALYSKDKYGVVVIDHAILTGDESIKYILESNSSQQILVVSDAVSCVLDDCEKCIKDYSIRRLKNPTSIKNIARMIGGFRQHKCDHYGSQTPKN